MPYPKSNLTTTNKRQRESEEEETETSTTTPTTTSDSDTDEDFPEPPKKHPRWDTSGFTRYLIAMMFEDKNWLKRPDGSGNFRSLIVAPMFESEEMRRVFLLWNSTAMKPDHYADELKFLVECGLEWIKEKHRVVLKK